MRAAILGGGISGLSAAFYLLNHPNAAKLSKIVVYESSGRLGGWMETTRNQDGVIYEHGPRTVRPAGNQGANTLEMVEKLGLAEKVRPIPYGHATTRNRMVLVDGKLHKLPSSLGSIFKPLPPFQKPLFLSGIKDLFTPPKICDDDSLFDFVTRRFGPEVATYAIDPMTRGICAGEAKEISASSFVAAPLFQREQLDGGVFRSILKKAIGINNYVPIEVKDSSSPLVKKARREKWAVWSLEGGIQTFVDELATYLREKDVEIRLETPVEALNVARDVKVNGETYDVAMSALPAGKMATIVPDHKELTGLLAAIPYVDVAVINVEFSGEIHLKCGEGFGLLVPSNQKNVPILGIIFDTCSFPQKGKNIFTVMMGGRWFEALFGKNPAVEDLNRIAIEQIAKILDIHEKPDRIVCRIHRDCIAQYTVGHKIRLDKMRKYIEHNNLPLRLVGSAYDGVGVNDAIMSAKVQVETVL